MDNPNYIFNCLNLFINPNRLRDYYNETSFRNSKLVKVLKGAGKTNEAKTELKRFFQIKNPTYPWDYKLYDKPEAEKLQDQIN